MGIHDRGYYREQPGQGAGGGVRFSRVSAWSVTIWLIVINVSIFALDSFLSRSGVPVYEESIRTVETMPPDVRELKQYVDGNGRTLPDEAVKQVDTYVYRPLVDGESGQPVGLAKYRVMRPLEAYGHFSTFQGFQRLAVWRLVTFQFLHTHETIWHLALNMLGLFVFGPLVEEQLGRKRYLAFYLTCGICGGLMYLILNLLGAGLGLQLPILLISQTTMPLVGASAGVFGVIMACAYIAPKSVVRLIFPPISLKMRTFAYAYVAFAAFNLIIGGNNAGGDAAHIGGAIAGAFFIRNSHLLRDFFDVFSDSRKVPARKAGRAGRPAPSPGPSKERRREMAEEKQIDAILDKINEQGLQSLTAREKKLLQRDTERRREA